jgi:acyl-CoA thioesterase-1
MVSVVVAAMTSAMVMLAAGALGGANAQTGPRPGGQSGPLTIVAFGDSLTAGYGLPASAAFPAQLQKALEARGRRIVIQNAGVSGDTAQAGLDRLDWSIGDGVDGVIVELGANDALRGLDPSQTKAALDAILTRLKQRGLPVLLTGMLAPPNMGPAYRQRFDGLYAELAAKHGVPLYPFFLDGVAGRRELNLPDGVHPTAQGVGVIVERILPAVEQWLDSIGRAR